MKTILKILLAIFVISLTPSTYVCAQGHIETPAERKARQEREAAAKKRRQQQEAAAQRQREEEARKKREAEEQAAREQAAREQAAREQTAREQAAREEKDRKLRLNSCENFNDGLAVYRTGLHGMSCGFINETGDIVIPCTWKEAVWYKRASNMADECLRVCDYERSAHLSQSETWKISSGG